MIISLRLDWFKKKCICEFNVVPTYIYYDIGTNCHLCSGYWHSYTSSVYLFVIIIFVFSVVEVLTIQTLIYFIPLLIYLGTLYHHSKS